MLWVCRVLLLIFLSLKSWAEVSNKNPFEPILFNQEASTSDKFVSIALTKQETFLKSLPEYSKKLKGIQSYRLNNEYRRAQYFYHKAVLNFISLNVKKFIKLNPTPEQVYEILKRAVVDPPESLFREHPLLFSKAFHIQRELLNHYLPMAGKLEAIRALISYEPIYIGLNESMTHIVESHIGHLTKIGLLDEVQSFKAFNNDRPYFFDTISYLKHFFHYPHLSPEQKTKKLISILVNTNEDVQIDYLKYKKELISAGMKVSADYLDETNSLQYANAKMQADFLESQLVLVLKNYLDRHLVTIKLNQYDEQRLLELSREFGYKLEFHNNKLIGLSNKPGFIEILKNIFSLKPRISTSKMCFLIFN